MNGYCTMNSYKNLVPLLLSLLLATNIALASTPAPILPNTTSEQQLCPSVEKLTRDEYNFWHAPGDWKSNTPSFDSTLDAFIGAQWVGVNLGEIICVYQKGAGKSFPVTLQRRILVFAPQGGQWSIDKGGYEDCKSLLIRDCPFFVQVRHRPKNPYDDLDFYKGYPVDK